MKAIMITGPSSNSGKTTLSLGLIRALKNRGIKVSPFKTGPDFVDSKYLSLAAGRPSGNLDIHMMGEEGLRKALSINEGEIAILEGAMGYFDGIYNTYENSSYDIGRKLDIPAILVYSPKGEMFTAIAKIKGMVEFEDSKIRGIILNKVTKSMYDLLKEQIEKYIGIKVLGYMSPDKNLEIPSRNLGLDLSKGEDYLDYLSGKLEETVDLDGVLGMASNLELEEFTYPKKRNLKIALAYDEAFGFYYNENIRLLENICDLAYFSPLRDKKIPDCDLVYFGGGYPELYLDQLYKNKELRTQLKDLGERGQYIIGESAGLIYLLDSMEGKDMVGLIRGHGRTTDKLGRFGYVNIELREDCILGKKGDLIKGQEFHKTLVENPSEEIFNISKPMSKRKWKCGYSYKNVLGFFQNINFLGNMSTLEYIFDQIEKTKGENHVY